MEWMILPLKRYAQFSGRSCRKEYWMFVLFSFLVSIVLSLVDSALGLGGHANSFSTSGNGAFAAGANSSGGILSGIWSLAIFIPSLAVGIRRLHDLDRSGWWYVAPLVVIIVGVVLLAIGTMGLTAGAGGGGIGAAVIGGLLLLGGGIVGIVLFVWFCTRGTDGPNRFGPDPLAPMNDLQETFR
jgi:uncharacterized membrane protein YhaH (DUF805 family)